MFGEMIGTISDFMYSYLLIIMLLAVGLYFTIRTRGVQLRLLAESIRVVGEKSSSRESVSAFQALVVSTASRVGTGNHRGSGQRHRRRRLRRGVLDVAAGPHRRGLRLH